MKTLAERLEFAISKKGITQDNLGKLTGTTQVTISHILSGKTKNPRNLVQLSEALGVNIKWLQNGEGEMMRADVEIIDDKQDYSDTHIAVDLYDIKLSAGNGNIVEWVPRKSDEPLLFREAWFRAKHLLPINCKAMYVKGYSMSPVLQNLDTVIVDISDTEIIDGEIYAIAYKDNLYIKQVVRTGNGVQLISFNTDFDPIEINEDNMQFLKIIGRKVWRGG